MRTARIAAVYLLLAVGLTWPAALRPVAAVPGSARGDLWDGLWSFWFFVERVTAGDSPLRADGLLNHPDGGSLWVADPVGALGMVVLAPLVGVAAGWTVLVLAHLVFTGLMGHRLGEAVADGRPGAGWIAGTALVTAPMLLAQVHNGATEAVGGGWLAWAAWRLWELRRAPTLRNGAHAGLALGVAAVAHVYAGVAGAVLAVLLGVDALLLRRGWRAQALAAAVALALAVPWGLAAREVTTAPDSVVGIKDPRQLATVRRTIGPADPVGFVHPGDYRSPDFRELARYGEDYRHVHYLGWALLLAALAGGRGRDARAWWVAVGLGVILAMGPVLARFGAPVILPGRRGIPLPYLLLESLPGFRDLSLVYRLAWLAVVALAALAARASPDRLRRLLPVLFLVETRLVSPAAALPDHADARPAAPLLALRDAPPGAVMNFPVTGGRAYLYEQAVHGQPLAATLNFPSSRAAREVWDAALDHLGDADSAFVAAVTAEARRQGVRYLVLHEDPLARPDQHDPAARRLAARFRTLAEGEGLRVVALW